MVRVFQSMQDTRTAFKLYLIENGLNIVFAIVLVGPLGVRGLALSLSIAYSVAALVALAVVRQRVGGLGGDDLTTPVKRVLGASAAMAVTTVLAVNVSGADHGVALLGRVVFAVVVGAATYVAVATVFGARHDRRRAEARAPLAPRPTRNGGSPPGGGDEGGEPAAPDPFRDRLGDRPTDPPSRHLRPVSAASEKEDVSGPGDEVRPGEEEEDDDPDPGGNRQRE
jgi:hypothetical protein